MTKIMRTIISLKEKGVSNEVCLNVILQACEGATLISAMNDFLEYIVGVSFKKGYKLGIAEYKGGLDAAEKEGTKETE